VLKLKLLYFLGPSGWARPLRPDGYERPDWGPESGVQGRQPLAGSGAEPQRGAGRSPAKKILGLETPKIAFFLSSKVAKKKVAGCAI